MNFAREPEPSPYSNCVRTQSDTRAFEWARARETWRRYGFRVALDVDGFQVFATGGDLLAENADLVEAVLEAARLTAAREPC